MKRIRDYIDYVIYENYYSRTIFCIMWGAAFIGYLGIYPLLGYKAFDRNGAIGDDDALFYIFIGLVGIITATLDYFRKKSQ